MMQKTVKPTLELILLIFFYLIVAAAGLQRTISAYQNYSFLEKTLPISPLYLILSGFFWFLTGAVAACWLWFALNKTPWVVAVSTILIFLTYWIERLFLYHNQPGQANLPFGVVFSICALLFAFTVIYLPAQRQRFFTRK